MEARLVASSVSVTERMSRQRRRDTKPEIELRKALFKRGLRFRVNYAVPHLPRRSVDIAFTRLRVAVFVNGCFWHACPEHSTWPSANAGWWRAKLEKNRERDDETDRHLAESGWMVIRVWEHEDLVVAAAAVEEAVKGRRAPAAL